MTPITKAFIDQELDRIHEAVAKARFIPDGIGVLLKELAGLIKSLGTDGGHLDHLANSLTKRANDLGGAAADNVEALQPKKPGEPPAPVEPRAPWLDKFTAEPGTPIEKPADEKAKSEPVKDKPKT